MGAGQRLPAPVRGARHAIMAAGEDVLEHLGVMGQYLTADDRIRDVARLRVQDRT